LKVNSADFLGKRELEVTRGTNGLGSYAVVVTQPISIMSLDDAKKAAAESPGHWQLAQDAVDQNSNVVFHAYDHVETVLDESNAALLAQCTFESNSIYVFDNTVNRDRIVASWWRGKHHYQNFTPNSEDAYLHAVETPPISDQLQAMVLQVQGALPGILSLTNQLATVLDNTANATSNLNLTVLEARPMLTNFTAISGQMIGAGRRLELGAPARTATTSAGRADERQRPPHPRGHELSAMLIELSGITSNLHAQVNANTNLFERHLKNRH